MHFDWIPWVQIYSITTLSKRYCHHWHQIPPTIHYSVTFVTQAGPSVTQWCLVELCSWLLRSSHCCVDMSCLVCFVHVGLWWLWGLASSCSVTFNSTKSKFVHLLNKRKQRSSCWAVTVMLKMLTVKWYQIQSGHKRLNQTPTNWRTPGFSLCLAPSKNRSCLQSHRWMDVHLPLLDQG